MCYVLTISTDMPDDLSKFNQKYIFFEKMADNSPENETYNLAYPNKYELATMQPKCCSCNLRIFGRDLADAIGFCELQDWLEEEIDEDVENVRAFFNVVKNIVNQGYKIDSYLCWNGEGEITENKMKIKVNEMNIEHFALFADTYFDYVL